MRSFGATESRPSTAREQRGESLDWREGDEPRPGRKKDRKKTRTPRWARLLITLGVLLIVASGGIMVTAKILLDKATNSITQVDINPGDNSVVAKGQALKGTLNILLVGVDDGMADGGEVRTEVARADSIMILHVPESHDQGYIVSLPRDLWVKVPRYPKTNYGGGSNKLNAAYAIGYGDPKGGGPGRAGGLELLMSTINQELGITFNAATTVNFTGFTTAVKQLGGVTMYIDERVTSVHYGTNDKGHACVPASFDSNMVAHPVRGCKGRVYEKGTRRLNAEEALDYTRQREWMELDDGDYGRQRHQQQFIKALVREAKAQGLTTNLPKALGLVSAVGSTLSMWTNGEKLEDWFFTLKDIAGSDIQMIKTNNGQFNPAQISGTSAEALSPLSKEMFAALRDKKINQFLLQHPDWLGQDS